MTSDTLTSKALDFVQSPNQLTAVIATATPEGIPHAATIYYYADHEFNMYFLTAASTQKHTNLLANSHTAIVIGTGPQETTIQGSGTSALLQKGSDEEAIAMVKIKKRLTEHDGTWPIFQIDQFDDEAIAVFKFTPTKLQLLNLEANSPLPQTTSDIEVIL